jgi:hypothetical protein
VIGLRRNRILLAIYSVWGVTLAVIGVGHLVLHRDDVGTTALVAHAAVLLGMFVGDWASKGEP